MIDLRAIDELSEALLRIREGREERLVVEISVLRLTRPEVVEDVDALTARIARMERQIKELERSGPPPAAAPTTPEVELPADRPFESPSRTTDDRRQTTDDGGKTTEASRAAESRGERTAFSNGPERPAQLMADGQESKAPETDSRQPTADSRAPAALTLAAFERVWPAVAATIRSDVGPRRHALLREASPVRVDGNVVVFEVAPHMHFYLEQLKSDAELANAIGTVAGNELGQPVSVRFQAADAPQPQATEPERAPDKDDLVEASSQDAHDPADTVLDILGGEVVEDSTT